MIELIAGGARSGKSAYALAAAEAQPGRQVFVATAAAGDAGMADRISRHQQERGDSWHLIEEPLLLSSVIANAAAEDVLLIDCLTLWVTNWLCCENPSNWPLEKQRFLDSLRETAAAVFLVTNEVGMGVVPMGQLSRDFMDQSGWLHQDIAALADRVTMVTFGIPNSIK